MSVLTAAPASIRAYARPLQMGVWLLVTAGLSAVLVWGAAANLHNYYPISGDDGWIMSASYKLAKEGVFGSDLYRGFFNAEEHYFIALPAYHFFQALSFKLFGFGVAQARLPSLLSGLLLLWVVSGLAYRQYGWGAGLLAGALLVLWRSNIIATEPRLPLMSLSQSGRYDLAATALVWGGVFLLDGVLRRPGPRRAFGLGLVAGLAALTQFFGWFLLPVIGVAWFWQWGRGVLRQRATYWVAAAFLLLVLPYAVYVASHYDDFRGQLALKQGRADFGDAAFYARNLRREPERYLWLVRERWQAVVDPEHAPNPFGATLLVVGALPAVWFAVRHGRRVGGVPAQLPWLATLCFVGCFALLERVKAPVYAILLFPGFCLLFAGMGMGLVRRVWSPGRGWKMRLVQVGLLGAIVLAVVAEGLEQHEDLRVEALAAHEYGVAGEEIRRWLRPGATVLGAERWWPALHEYDYRALNGLWVQWRLAEEAGRPVAWGEQMVAAEVDFIVMNDNARGELGAQRPALQGEFWVYVIRCHARVAAWDDALYGRIEVYGRDGAMGCGEEG